MSPGGGGAVRADVAAAWDSPEVLPVQLRILVKSNFTKADVGELVDLPSKLTAIMVKEGYAERVATNAALDVPSEARTPETVPDAPGTETNDAADVDADHDGGGEALPKGRKRRGK